MFWSTGKTIVSLTVDGEFLYWIMPEKDSSQIHQARKSNGAILSQTKVLRGTHILAYSSAVQPFPGNEVTFTKVCFSRLVSEHLIISFSKAVLLISFLGSQHCSKFCQSSVNCHNALDHKSSLRISISTAWTVASNMSTSVPRHHLCSSSFTPMTSPPYLVSLLMTF